MTPVLLMPVRMSSTPERLQSLGDERRGVELLEPEFRIFVQVSPIGDQAGQDLVDFVMQSCQL